jgi:hypothetical protein
MEQSISIIADGWEKTSTEHTIFKGLPSRKLPWQIAIQCNAGVQKQLFRRENQYNSCGQACWTTTARHRIFVRIFENPFLRQAKACVGDDIPVHRAHRGFMRNIDFERGHCSEVSDNVFIQKHHELPLLTRIVISTHTFLGEHILRL